MSSKGQAVGLNLLVALLLILGSQELLNVGVTAASDPVLSSPGGSKAPASDPCYRECVKTLKSEGVNKGDREWYCSWVVIDAGTGCATCTNLTAKYHCWDRESYPCDFECQ
jgi:hypothetical protein